MDTALAVLFHLLWAARYLQASKTMTLNVRDGDVIDIFIVVNNTSKV